MKITAITMTCNRPKLLSRLIRCFERQTHPDRELVILDDLGQYEHQSGDRWHLLSIPRRFRSLGEKRNAVAALASPDSEAIALWDDDDLYLDDALEAVDEALQRGPWLQPRQAYDYDEQGRLILTETFSRDDPWRFAYHASWAYRREFFARYRACYAGDDYEMEQRLRLAGETSVDIQGPPYYVYNRIKRHMEVPVRISEPGLDGPEAYYAMGNRAPYFGLVPLWGDDYSDWHQPWPTQVTPRSW